MPAGDGFPGVVMTDALAADLTALSEALDAARARKDWPEAAEAAGRIAELRGARKDHLVCARLRYKADDALGALASLDAAGLVKGRLAEPLLRARILERLGRADAAADAAALAVSVEDNPDAALLVRLRALDDADRPELEAEARALLAAHPDDLETIRFLLTQIADPIARSGFRQEVMESLSRLALSDDAPPAALRLLCALAIKAADPEALQRWARRGQAIAPDDNRFQRWLAKAESMAAPGQAVSEVGEGQLEDEEEPGGYPGARRYKAAIDLLDAGEIDAGVAALEALDAALQADPDLAPPNIRFRLRSQLPAMQACRDSAPAGAGLSPSDFDAIDERPVIYRHPDADAMLVVFCPGTARRNAWTRFFAGFPVHQVFIDDPKKLGGLLGLPGLGEDPPSNAAALQL